MHQVDITQEIDKLVLFDTVPAIILLLDEKGKILYFNAFMEKLSGHALDEVRGKDWFTTFLPDRDRKNIRKLFSGALDGASVDGNVNAIVTKSGEERLIRWHAQLVNMGDDGERHVLSTGMDVTELEREHDLSQSSERRFRQLFENMPEAFAVHEIICDDDGKPVDYRFLEANPAFEKLTGIPVDRLIGKTVLEVLPGTEDYWIETYGKVALTGESASFQNYSQALERHYAVWAFSPHPGQFATIFNDITEQKWIEHELAYNEEKYRKLVERSPAIIYEYGVKRGGRYYSPQAAEILGYSLKQLYDDPFLWNHAVHPNDVASIAEAMKDLGSGASFNLEYRVRDAQGRWIWLNDRSIGVREEDGDVIVTGLALDITRRKVSEMLLDARLRLTNMASELDHGQLMQATLDLAEELTDSNIGFFHFVEDDQETILLQAWSTHTIEAMCTAEGAGRHYPVSQAGVWADAIRRKTPVIHDDYASLPNRQGMPEGHAEVSRILTVPIVRHDKVVAAIGIGNKSLAYEDQDVEVLSQLANLTWDIIEVRKAEQALKQTETELLAAQHIARIGSWQLDIATNHVVWSDALYHMLGLNPDLLPPDYTEHHKLFTSDSWVKLNAALQHTQETGVPYELELQFIRPDGFRGWMIARGEAQRDESGAISGLHGIAMDITERKNAEISLEHANRALETLSTVNRELVHATEDNNLLQAICRAIVDQSGYLMAWVGYARDNADKDVDVVASAAIPETLMDVLQPGWGEGVRASGPTGRAIRTGKTQLSRDLADEPDRAWKEALHKAGCASSIALPLKVPSGRVFGALHVYSSEMDAFTDQEIGLLEEMASDLAFGVDVLRVRLERDEAMRLSEQHLAQMHRNLDETIAAISKAVEARDPYTAGHQRQVAKLAVAIGQRMGLDEDVLEGIHLGATIHDIGKITIPAEILSKPRLLNDMEYLMVKEHPKVGYDILKDIHFPWPVAEVAYQHHERMDGSGYPQGLKGDQICLEARIVAVADVVEAMTSHRPYRPGLGHERAMAEITDNRGRFYDADAVDACLAVFADGFSLQD